MFVMHLPALACALINAGLPNSRLVRDATPPPYRPPPSAPHQSPHHTTSRHQLYHPTRHFRVPSRIPHPPSPLLARSAIGMDTGSVTGGLAAGSHMRDELHVMRDHEEVS